MSGVEQNLLTRVLAAGLPLLVIALIFGGAGYALKNPATTPLTPLGPAEGQAAGLTAVVQELAGDQLSVTVEDGSTLRYRLAATAPVEALQPASLADLRIGDWLNGGAVQHAQTVLALVGLILIPDPVISP
jgi:hypothetical protein